MLKKTAEQKKIIAVFLMAVFCGMMATVLPLTKYFGIRSLSSLIYAGTVLHRRMVSVPLGVLGLLSRKV